MSNTQTRDEDTSDCYASEACRPRLSAQSAYLHEKRFRKPAETQNHMPKLVNKVQHCQELTESVRLVCLTAGTNT